MFPGAVFSGILIWYYGLVGNPFTTKGFIQLNQIQFGMSPTVKRCIFKEIRKPFPPFILFSLCDVLIQSDIFSSLRQASPFRMMCEVALIAGFAPSSEPDIWPGR